MKNDEKFFFSDFTYQEYERLLIKAKEHYVFSRYHLLDKHSPFILWRHDIDFSVHNAVDFAEIEARNDVIATYFIHLHSDFYNVLEKDVFDKLKRIISMGHDIGLHFDTHFYGIDSELELEKHIVFEKNLLESMFGVSINAFSFHNTNPFVLSCDKDQYAGLINTYSNFFQKQTPYCSDSYGVWRFRRLKEVIESATDHNLQVLTHPELWHKQIKSPIERVKNCIDGRARNTLNNYFKFLERNGREVIDWN